MILVKALLFAAAVAGLPFAGARLSEASAAAELLARAPRGLPGAQSHAQCESLEKRWTEFSKEISQAHDKCLNAGSEERPKRGLECDVARCESLHVLMSELGTGSLARRRRLQAQSCTDSANRVAEATRQAADRAQSRKQKSPRALEDAARRNDDEIRAALGKLGANMNRDEESLRQELAKETAIPRRAGDPEWIKSEQVERMRDDVREYEAALDDRESGGNSAAADEAAEHAAQAAEWAKEIASGGATLGSGVLEAGTILVTPSHENPSYLRTYDENHEVMAAVVIKREARKSYERELARTTDYYLKANRMRFRQDNRPTLRPDHSGRYPGTGRSVR